MRPIMLKLTAFGPYAGRQTIDFRELGSRNVFLITGNTGSGKTTIFDGISYALYDKGSSTERNGGNLRSHFAPDDVMTAVELDFELRGKQYHVKRMPAQLRKKTRGNGYTEQQAEAELVLPEGRVVTGSQAVTQKLIDILGLSYEQFRQIVMIPQGEFRQLLTAGSANREVILQQIFDTALYRNVQDKLAEQYKAITDTVKLLRTQRDEGIRGIDCEGNDLLCRLVQAETINADAVVDAARQWLDRDQEQEQRLQQAFEQWEQAEMDKREQMMKAEHSNAQLQELHQLAERKRQLEIDGPEYAERQQRLEQGRMTLALTAGEQYCQTAAKLVEQKQQACRAAEREIAHSNQQLLQAQQLLQQEKAGEPQRHRLSEQLTMLNSYFDKIQLFEQKQQNMQQLRMQLQQVTQQQLDGRHQYEQYKQTGKQLTDQLETARLAAVQYVHHRADLEKVRELCKQYDHLQDEQGQLVQLQQLHSAQSQTTALQHAQCEELQQQFHGLQERFFQGQAAILARTLQNDHPCPVCGSTHHPQPAIAAQSIPDQQELRQVEQQLTTAREQYAQIAQELNETGSRIMAQNRIVEHLLQNLDIGTTRWSDGLTGEIDGILDQLDQRWRTLTVTVQELQQQVDRQEPLAVELEAVQQSLQQQERELEQLNRDHMMLYAKVQSEQDMLEALQTELPAEVRSQQQLTQVIHATKRELQELTTRLEQAEGEYRKAELLCQQAKTVQSACEQALTEANEQSQVSQQRFATELAQAGFGSYEAYLQAKMEPQQLADLERQISEYYQRLRSVTDRYEQLRMTMEGVQLIDVTKLEVELRDIQGQKQAVLIEQKDVVARMKRNHVMLTNIMDRMRQLKAWERQGSVMGSLAGVATGKNSERITFERYVLAAFFDDIVAAANLRLSKMTANRYELHRMEQKNKGNAQSGLDLEVYDNYTGRMRHVTTLSGGESFKASLAWAFGLADVVQAYAGGISLDTMFIDEGFGSLDPESLDFAMERVMELQNSGRLVGIISHVPELKERIDARLEVNAGLHGSTARFHIL